MTSSRCGWRTAVRSVSPTLMPRALSPVVVMLAVGRASVGLGDRLEFMPAHFSHTNYTLMKEALETWPVDVLSYMLLRQIGLIYETNARFLAEVHARFSTDNGLLRGICR
jgi:starch phosphorylase